MVRTVDLFCGAGGSSWGARIAGAKIVAGFDFLPLAGKVYKRNFPEAQFYGGRLEDLDPFRIAEQVGPVDLLLASPECTNHSPAKGGKPRCERSKETAFQVVRFADVFQPRWIVIENVVSMRKWKRYQEFIGALSSLGYGIREQNLDSSLFGVPQTRRRLFILCDRRIVPSQIKIACKEKKPASIVIDKNNTFKYSPLRTKRRAVATIERAERAISSIGNNQPFLMVYYGSDHAGGWQTLERPLRTITTLDRFAYVAPTSEGHVMRMLQVPELKAAMGMPKRFQIRDGSRRDQVKLIGNAVCPPVMRKVVKSLIAGDT